ncbi:hypothetical protein X973_13635 [Piscirickettsia salmonis]|nr:hypothetical protein X973_13635 [Piscirickettsia salmonis]
MPRGFIVVAFCSAILHHWMCKIPTEVATLTASCFASEFLKNKNSPVSALLTKLATPKVKQVIKMFIAIFRNCLDGASFNNSAHCSSTV